MCTFSAVFFAALAAAAADPASGSPTTRTRRDAPVRKQPLAVGGPSGFAPSWDLDGLYLWLGPVGTGARIDGAWDTAFGAHLAITRVTERDRVGLVGGVAHAMLWSTRDGGRINVEALVGTRLGRMVGLSAGGVVELGALHRPRWGGTVGLWAFLGVAPFVRVGVVQDLGVTGEFGISVAFPVLRSR